MWLPPFPLHVILILEALNYNSGFRSMPHQLSVKVFYLSLPVLNYRKWIIRSVLNSNLLKLWNYCLKITFIQGYSGYGCSNDENAMSIQFQLVQMMLLTMSNLFFLPAIFIGFYRRYWQETTVYIIAMATSTLYHACDQFGTQKYYCIAPYDTLQFADFLAATVAVSTQSIPTSVPPGL